MPVGELFADGCCGMRVKAVRGELSVAVSLDAGKRVGEHTPVEPCIVPCGELDQLLPGVPGPEQSVDIDRVPHLRPAEQSSGLACGHVIRVQHRAEFGGHWRVVQKLGDQFDLAV